MQKFLTAGILAGLALMAGCQAAYQEQGGRKEDTGGAAGVKTEQPVLMIDYDKRYDVHLGLGDRAERKVLVVEGCRFVGFVGYPRHRPAKGSEQGSGRGSKSWSSYGDVVSGDYLDSFWVGALILEKPDGKKMYVKPEAVLYFEEAGK